MDPSTLRSRLRDDLRGQFRGDLYLDPASRALYSTDASLFQIEPLAVAAPRDEADLACLVRYAHERSIPVVPRGAGTGLAGESLGHGLVIDLSVHFRSILDIAGDSVRVQLGVVLDALNGALAAHGRRFAPDPVSGMSCTLGGMIGTDASGPRAARHGRTGDHVLALRVLWDDGTADEIARPATPTAAPRTREIREGLANLGRSHASVIATARARPTLDRCGYRLDELAAPEGPDLVRLLVGTEGTLCLGTAATLRTIPLPGGTAAGAIGFATLEGALRAALRARETGPVAMQVLDQRLVSLVRAQVPGLSAVLPPEAEGVLVVEFEESSPAAARSALAALFDRVSRGSDRPLSAGPASGDLSVAELRELRQAAIPSRMVLHTGPRPLPFVDDMGVPPDDLPQFVTRAKEVLKRHETSASFLVDPGTGHVDLRPFLDPDQTADAGRLWPLADALHSLAIEFRGTVSARYGTGVARTPWVEQQLGELVPVFRELKAVFDPRGIWNPGKVVGPDPGRPAWPLRTAGAVPTAEAGTAAKPSATAGERILVWQSDELGQAVGACNGCGACRTEDSSLRMCPAFRATHVEAATPRAKANLFRALLGGNVAAASDDLRAVADLCINCRMCGIECPSRADVPKLMLEAKAANHAAHGLRRSAWFLARTDGLAALGSRFAMTANLLLRRKTVRWLLEKVFGLSRRRTLPAFAARTFLSRARRRGLTRRPAERPAVAYFVDTYANVFDPTLAEATVAVLKHNGIPVYVPPRQRGSGAAALAQGDTDVARERLLHNVRRLADAARAGDTIVCSEPTAALFFQVDGPDLSDDPDVQLVAGRTVELTAYLWDLHLRGQLRTDFQTLDVSVGHHVPCHVKALGQGEWGPDLLALIPGMSARKIDVSCSGMAGTFGLNAQNMPLSLEAGRPMLEEFARPRHWYGSSECSACRLQMQQATGKRTAHPVQYLALAYGLLPGLADHLHRPFTGRVAD